MTLSIRTNLSLTRLVIITGVLLLIAVVGLYVLMTDLTHEIRQNRVETVKNRQVACESRFLNGEAASPVCDEYK